MKIALLNQYATYKESLPIAVLNRLCGNKLEFTDPGKAALIIVGSFKQRRSPAQKAYDAAAKLLGYGNKSALRLFHVYENVRHDTVPADYVISSDLGVQAENHFRLPYWMESLDWSKHGTANKKSNRVRRLLDPSELLSPRGSKSLERPLKAALFCAHLKEPRQTLYDTMSKIMPTDGFGPAFSSEIRSHDASGFFKDDILQDYAVNLCPENSLYPGYYTEKVVEAFGAGCLPVTWAEQSIGVDFNPLAFINALDFAATGYEAGLREALSPGSITEYADQPLLLKSPSIEPLFDFLRRAISDTR